MWLALTLVVSCRREPTTNPSTEHRAHTHDHAHAPPDAPTTAPVATAPATPTRTPAEEALWTRLGELRRDGSLTVIGHYGSVRIAYDDAPFIVADAPAFDGAEVIEEQGDRIRIVTRSLAGWAQLALWIDAADAAQQIRRAATLFADPKDKPKPEDGTLELAPGERIDILERTETHAKVRTRDEAFTGWVPANKLSAVFVDEPFELPRYDAETQPMTPVSRTPGGKPFYTFSTMENGTHPVRVTSSPRRGWVQIEHVDPCRRGVRVRGWVRVASTEIEGEQPRRFGCAGQQGIPRGKWGALDEAPIMNVPKDTELRTKAGVLFGRTLGEVELREGSDGTWHILTRWGPMPVVARPPG